MTKHSRKELPNWSIEIWVGMALAVCFIAGIGMGALLWRGDQHVKQSAVDTKQQTQLASSGYEAAGSLLVFADNLAKERGLTYAALKSTGDISEGSRSAIAQTRDSADRALTQALGLMSDQLAFKTDSLLMRRVSKNQESLEEMRTVVDGWTGSEDPAVNADRANKWFAVSSRLLTIDAKLLELVHSKIRSVGLDIESAVALKLQRLTIILIDFVGRERGIVSGLLEEKRIVDETASGWLLPAYRGRIGEIWSYIKAAASSNTLSPEITSLIGKVEHDYFEDMEQLRKRIQKARKAGEPYPVTAEEWFAKASTVIETIVKLGQEAGQLARSRSEKLRQAV